MANPPLKVSSNPSAKSPASSKHVKKVQMPKMAPSHPKTSVMVDEAIQNLAVHGAMSLQAIKKFVAVKYGPISDMQSRNINKYVKNAITKGSLVQPKGKQGITASFKIPSAAALAAQRKAAKAASTAEKTTKPKSSKATGTSKVGSSTKKQVSIKTKPKASTTEVKKNTTKITKEVAIKLTPKSPMTKKMTKSPTSKPKAPKPKKATTAAKPSKPAAKKTAAAKK